MCGRPLRAACWIALAGTLVLLIAPSPAGAQQGAAPPDRPWTPADVIPRVMQIRPEWPAPEAAPPVQPRVVRPALFDHWPPIREQVAPDGAWLVGTDEGHLYVRAAGRDTPDVLASATDAWRWDVAGARWAPGAEWIAVRRIHDADVPSIPIVDWAADAVRAIPYTRAGEPLPTHRLWVVHRPSGTIQAVPHTPGTTYVHAVGWSPDGGPGSASSRPDRFPRRRGAVHGLPSGRLSRGLCRRSQHPSRRPDRRAPAHRARHGRR